MFKNWHERNLFFGEADSPSDSQGISGLKLHYNILIYIQQDAMLHGLFYLETALHVSGGTSTHHQDPKQLIYSFWYLSGRYCYLPL